MPIIQGFSILLLCQLLGELVVAFLSIPIPGSVVGMVVLFVGLIVLARVPECLMLTSEGLLKCLPLLLVPAGVGLMNHFGVLSEHWLGLAVSLFVSTLVTMLFVSIFLKYLSPANKGEKH